MAASILSPCARVAVFKTTLVQVWGLRRLPSALFLCTKPSGSKKDSKKKTKPPVDTVQETNDISTYKNLQHHEYTPYTFVDYDVLLSKMRLPQPSSGRLSPRH